MLFRFAVSLVASALLTASIVGCAHNKQRQPPGKPPSPESVTRKEPGGDAFDVHTAALQRLREEGWGWRNDRNDVFHFPLSDWGNWRRVRFWGLPTFVAFRYGDAHRAVSAMFVRRLPPDAPADLNLCFDRMEQWAKPIAESFETTYTKGEVSYVSWKSKDDVMVMKIDADVKALFSTKTYLAVVGVTFGWPQVCLAYGYAFRVQGNRELAESVRSRYAREAFSRLTVDDPMRYPDGVDDLP